MEGICNSGGHKKVAIFVLKMLNSDSAPE